MQPVDVLETCLYVDDLDAAREFYTTVLNLPLHSEQAGRHVFLKCGQGMLLLFQPEASNDADSDLPRHGAHGAGHLAFTIHPDDLPGWRERLKSFGVEVEQEVEWDDRGTSIYFRDPAGNSLEFAPPSIWGLANPTRPD